MSDRRVVLFVSDGTGITVQMLGHSLLTQFEGLEFKEITLPFIDSLEKAESECMPRIREALAAGNGAPSHLAVELFKVMAQIDVVHVPYKGMAPALTDVLGGQLQFSMPTIAGGLPLSRSGKLRALAVTGAKRSPAEPDLPTVAEAGVPGYQASNWYGMAAPAKTPRVLVLKLNQEFTRIMAVPELRDKLLNVGMEPTTTTPEQFTEYVKTEVVKLARVVKSAGIKAD